MNDGANSLQRYYLNNFIDADRQEGMDLRGVSEVSLGKGNMPRNGFDLRFGLKRGVKRVTVMQDDVKSMPGEGQGKGFSKPVCCTGDEGNASHVPHYKRWAGLRPAPNIPETICGRNWR